MIRLKDILLEGPSDPNEKANRIAKHLFGGAYALVNKTSNPKNNREIIFTYSDGTNTRYINKLSDWTGNFTWFVYNNNEWEKIPPKSIPKIHVSPEELAARAERKRQRQEMELARQREEELRWNAYYAKYPNIKTDIANLTTGHEELDFYMQNSGLSERERVVISLRHKGYTRQAIATKYNVTAQRIRSIEQIALKKMRTKVKLDSLK